MKIPKYKLVEYLLYMYKGKYTEGQLRHLPTRQLFGWYTTERNKRLKAEQSKEYVYGWL